MPVYRGYPGWYLDAGYGPDDIDEPKVEVPSSVTVTVFLPTVFRDVDTGELTTITAPQSRSWPLFCERAAMRWARYWERRGGKGNVWVDYD